ncbi:hypothetical protein [Pseudonocardia lacus]|jgi:hypothetical protein|uniref:hypothetical protein n=1 Tax=Pseudonocardia lacus TaxID=2835865 RepID=UPI001BDBDAAB|nr:hypothetical protein [Pseudonocardia lacus]
MYEIETYEDARDQLAELPREALLAYAEVLAVLEIAPWSGAPYNRAKPSSPMRRFSFGRDDLGMVVYLVLEHDRRVDVVGVYWLG